jgi:hypothetical protein
MTDKKIESVIVKESEFEQWIEEEGRFNSKTPSNLCGMSPK